MRNQLTFANAIFADATKELKKGGKKINKTKHFDRIIGLALAVLICALSAFNIVFYDIMSMDKKQTIRAGTEISIPETIFGDKVTAAISNGADDASIAASADYEEQSPDGETAATSYDAVINLDGLPLKEVVVEETESIMVQPGGQSIGILLQTDGVSVVGFSPVITEDGSAVNPASDAGLVTGDFITSINGQKIDTNAQIAAIIDEAGKANESCEIVYLRNGIRHTLNIEPLFCTDSQSWRIGLYVRDNTAGIGTLSFYEPNSGVYGALGHEVPDLQYGVSGEKKGTIVRAAVQGIKIGASGDPGEKLGVFLDEDWAGDIRTNSTFGIYGVLDSPPEIQYTEKLVPVAMIDEVQTGPAEIYTVLDGETIQSFDIEIVKLMPGYKLTGKGMIIKVTDAELLEKTGGIVQGMSGSPIIQNGMFVGAVTHVFINDPTQGYGCFGEWMLEDAGLYN